MAEIIIDNQSTPTTPSSGVSKIFTSSTNKILNSIDDEGRVQKMLQQLTNSSTANQTGFASDTYLTGSRLLIPNNSLAVANTYHLIFDMVKTGAGTATPVINIRFGTAGAVGDTARLTFTFGAGTAVADTGTFEVWVHFRSIGSGASAILTGIAQCRHGLAVTGLTSTGASGIGTIINTGSGFDSTVANSYIGASFNGGASFSGTNVVVQSQLLYTYI